MPARPVRVRQSEIANRAIGRPQLVPDARIPAMTVVCVLRFLGSFGRTLKAHCTHVASKEATEHARNLELAAVMSKSRDVVWERGDSTSGTIEAEEKGP
jgi:hypothetical protein